MPVEARAAAFLLMILTGAPALIFYFLLDWNTMPSIIAPIVLGGIALLSSIVALGDVLVDILTD